MTPEEAKQKIIDKVLATKEGWIASHVDVFDKCKIHFYTHPDIPDTSVKMVRSFASLPIQYEFSICVEKHVLALDKDPNGPIAAIVENGETNNLKKEIAERDNKLIAIAQSL